MTHVLVTGAGGFIGQALVQRLLLDDPSSTPPIHRLTALDQHFDREGSAGPGDGRVRRVQGDLGDRDTLARAFDEPVDLLFHLASVPGSLAERRPELGSAVNLRASIDLLQELEERASTSVPRVVFASSIAVYGPLDPEVPVNESTPARPALSYGAHKLMLEVLLADQSRRGVLDGVSLRLPGIVARPASSAGHGSAFMSDLIRQLCAGQSWQCPVSEKAQAWWMSLRCCVDNLLHAARLPSARLPPGRVVQLPVLTATVAELVQTIERMLGRPAAIRYVPDQRLEQIFGRYPPLDVPLSRNSGFTDDGDLRRLIESALTAA